MTIRKTIAATLLCVATAQGISSQETDSLYAFQRQNPTAVEYNVIHEGTKLYLAADDDNLLVVVSLAHPALQMRFLMQSATVCIDPTGRSKSRFKVLLPSAPDVRDQLQEVARENVQAESGNRPDIRPLVDALNGKGAVFMANGQARLLDFNRFRIEIDTTEDVITYHMLLPKAPLMAAKRLSTTWSLGILSDNTMGDVPPPEDEQDNGMMPPPADGESQEDMMHILQNNIRSWTKFAIDDVNNANITLHDDMTHGADTLTVAASVRADSIEISVASTDVETQLTFLMQGMTMRFGQADSLTVSMPSADMVHGKVRRHPNEVKAVLDSRSQTLIGRDSVNQVIRPDVMPLVAALNDTTATVATADTLFATRHFHIYVDREATVMNFTCRLPACLVDTRDGNIKLTIASTPLQGMNPEFDGTSLSREKAPMPEGLGKGPRGGRATGRNICRSYAISINQH